MALADKGAWWTCSDKRWEIATAMAGPRNIILWLWASCIGKTRHAAHQLISITSSNLPLHCQDQHGCHVLSLKDKIIEHFGRSCRIIRQLLLVTFYWVLSLAVHHALDSTPDEGKHLTSSPQFLRASCQICIWLLCPPLSGKHATRNPIKSSAQNSVQHL